MQRRSSSKMRRPSEDKVLIEVAKKFGEQPRLADRAAQRRSRSEKRWLREVPQRRNRRRRNSSEKGRVRDRETHRRKRSEKGQLAPCKRGRSGKSCFRQNLVHRRKRPEGLPRMRSSPGKSLFGGDLADKGEAAQRRSGSKKI